MKRDGIPTAEQAWLRAQCMICCVYRADIESELTASAAPMLEELQGWIATHHLSEEMTETENEILQAPHGKIPQELLIKAGWMEEGAATIGWVLGIVASLPSFEKQVLLSEDDLFKGFQFLAPEAKPIEGAVARGKECEPCAEYFGAITTCLRKSLGRKPVENFSFSSLAQVSCSLGQIAIVGGDLALDGIPLRDADTSRQIEVLSIATERYRAFSWLAGWRLLFEEEPLEVAF